MSKDAPALAQNRAADNLEAAKAAFEANWEKLLAAGSVKP